METYQRAAKREYEIVKANIRTANHEVILKYYRGFTNLQIIELWSKIKPLLVEHGIVAFGVIEITTRTHIFPNGEQYDYPTKKCHYHFLIESDLSPKQLRTIFIGACLDAGLCYTKPNKNFGLVYEQIPDRKEFLRKCRYILKYAEYAGQAILFRPYTGINKIYSIGRWFINPDGTRANKEKIWDEIVAGWYPENSTTTQRQPLKFTIQFTIPCNGILGIIFNSLFTKKGK
jgi:hypothetical protein